ncbi:MAG: TasA family protein [Acutalibacteraceae bacterium]|nr:TasA family protein [Acutalibacteraceae bacterium]
MKLIKEKQENKTYLSAEEQIEEIEKEIKQEKLKSPKYQGLIALGLAGALLIAGSFAYFSDRVTTQIAGTAGTVKVSIDDSNINLLDANGRDILNPGDIRDFGFSIQNEGNKSVDAKAIITLTSSVPMINPNTIMPMSLLSLGTVTPSENLYRKVVYSSEYELYNASDVVYVEGYGHYPKDGVSPLQTRAQNTASTQIVYTIDNLVLSGNETLSEQEVEYTSNSDSSVHISEYEYNQLSAEQQSQYTRCDNSKAYDLVLLFDPNAENKFQNSNVSIKVDIYAKQHRNTNDSVWIKTDSSISSIIRDSELFEIGYDDMHKVTLTGVKSGVNLSTIENIVIPEGVQTVPESFFANYSNIKTVTLPSTIIELQASAFNNCPNLNSINLPDGLESIGDEAFASCKSLKSITIPGSVIYIGNAFAGSGLETVIIEEGITELGKSCFANAKKLNTVTLPNTLKTIGEYAFCECTSLTNITIPNSVTTIKRYAFINSGLTNITIPNSVTTMEDSVFAGCKNLQTVVFSNNMNTIPDSMFASCTNLTSFTIDGLPANTIDGKIQTIAFDSFTGTALHSITIGSSVKKVENSAFDICNSLTEITIEKGPKFDSSVFYCFSNVNTTVYTENVNAINYNWRGDRRIVTFVPALDD